MREQIAALAAKPQLVPHDFGGIPCYLKKWGERGQIEWAIVTQTAEKVEGVEADLWSRCKAIVRSLCDENGVMLYKPEEHEQIAELDPEIIDAAWQAVIKLQSRAAEDDSKKN